MSSGPNMILEAGFFAEHVSLFDQLMRVVTWDERMKARKTASFGRAYDYSQMTYEETELLPCLRSVQRRLKERLGIPFNNCLLNLYETDRNTMGFHSDEIENLMPGTGVAIVSLGSERSITFRSMDHQRLFDFSLSPGSMLYMGAEVQADWQHSIRRQSAATARISLTWRAVQ